MNITRTILSIAVILVVIPGHLSSQEPEGTQQGEQDMDAMMKMWAEVATPGDAHKLLNGFVGNWETETTMWMDPEHPMITKGEATAEWVLGGRFLRQEFHGEMMGKPLNGIGFTGYDIYNKKYVGFWIDNSSTAMFTSEGGFDRSGTTLIMYGKMDEWLTGERDKNVNYITRFISPDLVTFEIHDLSIGEENTKVVEITYRRKKG